MAIEDILKFIKLTHKFQKVERKVFIIGQDRMENDFEHSYQLAMLAWYMVNVGNFELDKDKVIKYALIHDFVEVYAGDIDIYTQDKAGMKELKAKNEKEAQNRLKEEFSEFSDMNDLIELYEARNDKESRFVYALDKLIPIINIYLDKGRTWKEFNVTLDMMIKVKSGKVELDKDVKYYFDEMVKILKSDGPSLFAKI